MGSIVGEEGRDQEPGGSNNMCKNKKKAEAMDDHQCDDSLYYNTKSSNLGYNKSPKLISLNINNPLNNAPNWKEFKVKQYTSWPLKARSLLFRSSPESWLQKKIVTLYRTITMTPALNTLNHWYQIIRNSHRSHSYEFTPCKHLYKLQIWSKHWTQKFRTLTPTGSTMVWASSTHWKTTMLASSADNQKKKKMANFNRSQFQLDTIPY